MKRIITLAALLLAASACNTTTQGPAANTSAPPVNANATPTPQAAATVSDSDITAKEKGVWDAIKNKDFDGFASMLADDEVYVSDDGIHDKADTVKGVKELALTDVSLSDWKVLKLDKDAAVVTYTLNLKGTSGGRMIPPTDVRCSTAWVNRGGKWQAIYHQDCEARPAQASPSPGASPAAKTGATPTASPAATTSPNGNDHEALERIIWDALKRKDSDAFANLLSDDAVEIEPDGVYDKTRSINSVKQFDFSHVTLSDFKVVKLDDDAALVTYMVKGPPPAFGAEGERHSTIQVERGGKWLAAFHHGTPQAKPRPK